MTINCISKANCKGRSKSDLQVSSRNNWMEGYSYGNECEILRHLKMVAKVGCVNWRLSRGFEKRRGFGTLT